MAAREETEVTAQADPEGTADNALDLELMLSLQRKFTVSVDMGVGVVPKLGGTERLATPGGVEETFGLGVDVRGVEGPTLGEPLVEDELEALVITVGSGRVDDVLLRSVRAAFVEGYRLTVEGVDGGDGGRTFSDELLFV